MHEQQGQRVRGRRPGVDRVEGLTVDDDACTDGLPDTARLDQIARLGGDLYTRVNPQELFSMARPQQP